MPGREIEALVVFVAMAIIAWAIFTKGDGDGDSS
jgi:hypothetical protein